MLSLSLLYLFSFQLEVTVGLRTANSVTLTMINLVLNGVFEATFAEVVSTIEIPDILNRHVHIAHLTKVSSIIQLDLFKIEFPLHLVNHRLHGLAKLLFLMIME
jgi:hypothetical protein